MGGNYKSEILECFNDLKSKKTFYKQIPNLLTFSRMIGVIPVNILYFTGNILPALILSVCLFVTDFFDGKIARKYNIVSSFGAKLDAVCDKIMALGLAIPIIGSNPLILVNLVMEGLISIVNIVNEKRGYNPKTTYIGKVKTWLLSGTLGLGYLTSLINAPMLIFNLVSMITVLLEGVTLVSYINLPKKERDIFLDIELKGEDKEEELIYQEKEEKIEYLRRERENIINSNIMVNDDIKRLKRTK